MDMQEINILTEKDLPYFEELEEKGQAVILRFPSMEAFAAFDLAAYLGEEAKPLSLEDVQKWIAEEGETIEAERQKLEEGEAHIHEMQDAAEIYLMISSSGLTGREHSMLMAAVQEGRLKKEQLDEILNEELSDEERTALIFKVTKKNK